MRLQGERKRKHGQDVCCCYCSTAAPSCTLGDFLGARSCGARFSGMTMASKGNKSADATTPLRRLARDSWRVIQSGSNWHAIPVRVPLTNTENEKMTIATANPVTFKFYEFFSVKIRGTNRWTSFGEKKQALGGLGSSESFKKSKNNFFVLSRASSVTVCDM